MRKTSETVVFFGSGPVAAESLRLLANDFTIEQVVTKPRPEHHHGPVPVLEVASELNLPVLTAANKRELDKLFDRQPVKSRLAVLIDFGIIVSQEVINYFPLGIVNSHFSLLPEWRGADPITFSILSGQKQTGVSLMLLTAGMDEGPLLGYAPFALPENITAPELTAALIDLSYGQLAVILPLYAQGKIAPQPQDLKEKPTYSRKLSKEDSLLQWHKPAVQLEREIRAFLEWPRSRTTFGNLGVIVTQAHVVELTGSPGGRTIHNRLPTVYCGDKALALDRLKPAGKKEMTGESFLAGYKHVFLS